MTIKTIQPRASYVSEAGINCEDQTLQISSYTCYFSASDSMTTVQIFLPNNDGQWVQNFWGKDFESAEKWAKDKVAKMEAIA